MKLNPQDLEKIAEVTLGHYNAHAEDFWEGTRGHDVSQNIDALLRTIEDAAPFALLDFGCGPGRDLKVLAERGHRAVGLEGAARLAEMARAHSGCEVWEQDFLKLDLPDRRFDGVFANAALFHVPSQALAQVLQQLHATLKPRGVLCASNPHGENVEGWVMMWNQSSWSPGADHVTQLILGQEFEHRFAPCRSLDLCPFRW